jgi:hypothetical protein
MSLPPPLRQAQLLGAVAEEVALMLQLRDKLLQAEL